jgi:hypothetical protein
MQISPCFEQLGMIFTLLGNSNQSISRTLTMHVCRVIIDEGEVPIVVSKRLIEFNKSGHFVFPFIP